MCAGGRRDPKVSRLSGGRLVPLFAAADSVFIDQVAASPGGGSVAMVAEPCTRGSIGLVVRDLATGTQRSIGTGLPRCTNLGDPAWNSTGNKLVIPYGAVPNPRHLPRAGVCPATRYAQLAITSALGPSKTSDWQLTAADPGCSFEAATFDPSGIATVEACRRKGQPASHIDPALGQARLLQLNPADQVTARINLKPGWEQGAITTAPGGQVLISQDQPANEPYPERDWVWEFDGRHLRLIRDYKADDGAQIIAIPYQQSPTTGSSSKRAVTPVRSAGRGSTSSLSGRSEPFAGRSTTGRFSVRPTSGAPTTSSGDYSARVLGSMGQRSGEMRACDRGDLRLALNEAACHRPGLLNPPRVRRFGLDWSIMPRNGQIFGHTWLPRRVSGRYSTYRRTLAAGHQLRLQRQDRSRTAAYRAAPTMTKRARRDP
jgi:hypothetical protein